MPGPRGWGSTAAGCRVPGHLPRHLAGSGRSRPSASQDAPHPGRSWSEAPGPGRAGLGSSAGPPRCRRGSPGPVAGSAPGPSPSAPRPVSASNSAGGYRDGRGPLGAGRRGLLPGRARPSTGVAVTRSNWSWVWRASRDGCSRSRVSVRSRAAARSVLAAASASRISRSHGWGGCARHRFRAGAPPRWRWGLCARWGLPPARLAGWPPRACRRLPRLVGPPPGRGTP